MVPQQQLLEQAQARVQEAAWALEPEFAEGILAEDQPEANRLGGDFEAIRQWPAGHVVQHREEVLGALRLVQVGG